jgi:hypothetical protein
LISTCGSVVRGAAALAVVLAQSACVATQKPAESAAQAPAAGDASTPMTIADASAACDGVQANSEVPVTCTTDYIENVPSMIVGFRTIQEAQQWLRPFAEQVGGPFCDAANRASREARVYMSVGEGDRQQVRRYSCELGKWGNWFANARANAAPAAPPAASAPAAAPAPPSRTMADVVRVCNDVQANADLPVSCKTEYVNGVPSVVVGFPSAAAAKTYIEQVAQQVAQPFCDAANRSGHAATFFITVANEQARRYDCKRQSWSEWFELPRGERPARTTT